MNTKMRKNSILCLFYILLFSTILAAPCFGDMKYEPDGFRGIPRGAPAPQKRLFSSDKWGLDERYIQDYPPRKVYLQRKDDVLSLGGADLRYIHYTFHDSLGFSRVEMAFDDRENLELIHDACVESWGEPDGEIRKVDENIDILRIVWRGEKVTAHIVYYNAENTGRLEIYLKNYYDVMRQETERALYERRGF